ncbi:GTP cyclohydrolase I [Turicibacter bilis]|uniref:GTP cyclohydrolase 1 n=1 Tax=Turicibacter bilis TaxID=2735723 RepID=A0A9Q9CF61_9FIRM|nr:MULTISPECIES: GTP cyclohydrolase I [Turicibacter]MDD6761125.1 GTP cyclohydrolase I [Turicibacter sp.]CUN66200.1 GTP cyclohydrolase 1 [Turicibacter sanguinis]AMC09446.1 GTP cyclohydrolase [Turicibacter sp. H121]MBS3197137.1 GTP cyclohydrolase I [Turicibacter bilis]MBS3199739.1 GTP cyclohydrolase I [Turicibacter bilis]
MKRQIDIEKISSCIREILIALGDDPDREGLRDTPKRVAKMYEEVFAGMTLSNDEIAQLFGTTFDEEDMVEQSSNRCVIVRDIPIFSYCEHHLALMYNMKVSVAYLPKEKMIGLSKIARIADMVGRRLQLQERIGEEIAEIVEKITESDAIIVMIHGEHSCMTSRGIKKPGTLTTTVTYRGERINHDSDLRQELLMLMK